MKDNQICTIKELSKKSGFSIPHINNNLSELEREGLANKEGKSWIFSVKAVDFLRGMTAKQMKKYTHTMKDLVKATEFSESKIRQYLTEMIKKGLAIQPRQRLLAFKPESSAYVLKRILQEQSTSAKKKRKRKKISVSDIEKLKGQKSLQMEMAINLYNKGYQVKQILEIVPISRQTFYNYKNQIEKQNTSD